MSNPRLRDLDHVLDAAEKLVAQDGIEALTIRALTKACGVSNGAIYRTFDSRAGLVGRAWIRAERRFLQLLTRLVDDAWRHPSGDPLDAVHAAAETSLLYPQLYPASSALLMALRRAEVMSQPMPREVADQLHALQRELADMMAQLATGLWDRRDAGAVDLIATCIVDLPKWIAPRAQRYGMPRVRDYLRAAVRSVLAVGPPPVMAGHDGAPPLRPGDHRRAVAVGASSAVG
ncbi:TetR/AcrR family transcriptional regulator [Mycobacterium shinjukuense]|uniref:Putative transcriptional regulator, TetR n=1 Tax=Mycobacterium shinjukuense TaxID=398694 RepID=A0A7I7MS66_9MYCO|nr:TetR/AcrR family transcriptional regulator [Mycobacterium shinjukuense]ORB70271.1 hypothetical protein BST45_07130 [Mycobacterium shinjukuense]BBX74099.1 putative transcriptional regulator, TetR [Mycobacterium shinjukuense]